MVATRKMAARLTISFRRSVTAARVVAAAFDHLDYFLGNP
jgi:hypothetical protein